MSSQVGTENSALGGPGKSNGCCCACFGAIPGPIDPQKITTDGGKYVILPDSRVLEYFVYGSTDDDATVLVQISGSFGTGRIFLEGDIQKTCRDLNIKGISITVPGHGYSTVNVGHRMVDFAHDAEHVFKAEKVVKFIVEGTSYGTAHAMALAWYFGKQGRVKGMHLHVPFIPVEISQQLDPKLPKAQALEVSTKDLQNCSSCYNFCFISFACSLVGVCQCCCAPDIPEYPKAGAHAFHDTKRSVIHSVYGSVFNTAEDHVLTNWGFDIKEIPLKGPNQVLVSYANDDEDAPPDHGKWLGEYFEATVNSDGGNKHVTYLGRFFKGKLLQQFYELTVADNSIKR